MASWPARVVDDESRQARPVCSVPTRTDAVTITLVGMPGCGKSTVGRHLARHLGLRLVDSDHEIEQRIGCRSAVLRSPRRGRPSATSSRRSSSSSARRRRASCWPPAVARCCARPTASGCANAPCVLPALHARGAVPPPAPRHAPAAAAGGATRCAGCATCSASATRCTGRRRTSSIETGRPSVPTLVNMVLMQLELAGLVDPSRVPSPVDAARQHDSADRRGASARAPARTLAAMRKRTAPGARGADRHRRRAATTS